MCGGSDVVHRRVSQRFSGAVPGRRDALGLNTPAIDRRWDAPQDGPARVAVSETGVELDIDLAHVDDRFHGRLQLRYKARLTEEELVQIPARTLAFGVSPEYVFHTLGVRAKPRL
ncbi:MAG: hypothetical protein JO152_10520 [Mycobacteriaceae bacterium]|nr:hypothetical protein [Mycobacteriaceae bacterium]